MVNVPEWPFSSISGLDEARVLGMGGSPVKNRSDFNTDVFTYVGIGTESVAPKFKFSFTVKWTVYMTNKKFRFFCRISNSDIENNTCN